NAAIACRISASSSGKVPRLSMRGCLLLAGRGRPVARLWGACYHARWLLAAAEGGLVAVLVAGVGYIGAALVASLVASGERVVGLDNGFATDASALAELTRSGEFCLIDGSVTSARSVARAFAQGPIRTVYHTAAQASGYVAEAHARYTEATNL